MRGKTIGVMVCVLLLITSMVMAAPTNVDTSTSTGENSSANNSGSSTEPLSSLNSPTTPMSNVNNPTPTSGSEPWQDADGNWICSYDGTVLEVYVLDKDDPKTPNDSWMLGLYCPKCDRSWYYGLHLGEVMMSDKLDGHPVELLISHHIDFINSLDDIAFTHENRRDVLLKKLDAAMDMIDRNNYKGALNKFEHDIIPHIRAWVHPPYLFYKEGPVHIALEMENDIYSMVHTTIYSLDFGVDAFDLKPGDEIEFRNLDDQPILYAAVISPPSSVLEPIVYSWAEPLKKPSLSEYTFQFEDWVENRTTAIGTFYVIRGELIEYQAISLQIEMRLLDQS